MAELKIQEDKNKVLATGRRKESVARVFLLYPGKGKVTVNKRDIEDYFKRKTHRIIINQPFDVTSTKGKYDVVANVRGGGESGQAGAVRLGIARALVKTDENLKKLLKGFGFMTRDPRAKERKKYGRKRARRRFQFTKR